MCDKSDYFNTLEPEVQKRYIEKIKHVNNVDPYIVNLNDCSGDIADFPKVCYFDIINYLVYTKSAYTQKEFRAHKSLEAYKFFQSKWVKVVRVKKITGVNKTLILSKVMHSQRLNLAPVNVWLIVENEGEVVCAHCDCIAGLGECCSHVGAVLFAVEDAVRNVEQISVTDVKAYWVIPNDKLGAPSKVKDINYTVKRYVSEENDSEECDDLPDMTEKFKNFLSELNKLSAKSAVLHVTAPYCYGIIDEAKREANAVGLLTNLFSTENVGKSLAELIALGRTVEMTVSSAACREIEEMTRKQSKSKKWFLYREGRITASKFKAVCRTKIENPSISLLKGICYPTSVTFSSKQTAYGCKHEKDAITAYKQYMLPLHTNFSISNVGLVINSNMPFFGASPDALVNCDCCGEGCVEVKCPFCVKDTTVEELIDLKNTCLKETQLEGGALGINLDRKHIYYYQVQMQMAVTGRQYCHFVVWSQHSFFVERISFDEQFWVNESQLARNFFSQVVMPELLGKYFTTKKEIKSTATTEEFPGTSNLPLDPNTFVHDTTLNTSICKCKNPNDDSMIRCNNPFCSIKWYHLKCVGMKRLPTTNWCCKKCTNIKM